MALQQTARAEAFSTAGGDFKSSTKKRERETLPDQTG